MPFGCTSHDRIRARATAPRGRARRSRLLLPRRRRSASDGRRRLASNDPWRAGCLRAAQGGYLDERPRAVVVDGCDAASGGAAVLRHRSAVLELLRPFLLTGSRSPGPSTRVSAVPLGRAAALEQGHPDGERRSAGRNPGATGRPAGLPWRLLGLLARPRVEMCRGHWLLKAGPSAPAGTSTWTQCEVGATASGS